MIKVSLSAKSSDGNSLHIYNYETGETLYEQEDGYMPDCSLGGGDYIDFVVDNETGQILNWKPIDYQYLIEDS
jgi:hypothetical protein